MDFEIWTLDFGHLISDLGFGFLILHFWILDLGCLILAIFDV